MRALLAMLPDVVIVCVWVSVLACVDFADPLVGQDGEEAVKRQWMGGGGGCMSWGGGVATSRASAFVLTLLRVSRPLLRAHLPI